MLGGLNVTFSNSAASLSVAGVISWQCEGTLTLSGMLFLPSATIFSDAKSTPATLPAITTCPGALKLAGLTTACVCAAATASHICCTSSSGRPKIAAILPVCDCMAALIYRPRWCTSFTASAKLNTPAAHSALYSPSECPATYVGCKSSSSRSTRQIAILAVNSAGWVYAVSSKDAAPDAPWHIAHKSNPRAVEASSNVALTIGYWAAQSFSMPTPCEPCPGKITAYFIEAALCCDELAG